MGRLRIEEFYNAVSACKTDEQLTAICSSEKQYINQNYSSLASQKDSFTKYRNGMKAFYLKPKHADCNVLFDAVIDLYKKKDTDKMLEIATKHKVSLSALKKAFTVYATVRKYLKLEDSETIDLNKTYNIQVRTDMTILKKIKDVDGYISKARGLLNDKSYITRILALAALTGRRVAEIGTSASFELIADADNEILFDGQLKTKGRDCPAYKIPVLANPTDLVLTLQELRTKKPQFINDSVKFHDASSKHLSVGVKLYFSEFVEGNITPKDLRAIYATICCKLLKNNDRKTPQSYYAEILGHSESDHATCNSYFDYYID
jgi:integrase